MRAGQWLIREFPPEQRTENPRVGGSIPPPGHQSNDSTLLLGCFGVSIIVTCADQFGLVPAMNCATY